SLHNFETNTVTDDLLHAARLRDQSLAVANISHEILGSLTAAKLQTQLMEMRLDASDGVDVGYLRKRCSDSLAGLKRAEALARSTLDYAGRATAVRTDCSLVAAVH